jgi:hypothetical protein
LRRSGGGSHIMMQRRIVGSAITVPVPIIVN